MHKMRSISLKMVQIVILSENSCHFVNCSASTRVIFFSAWDKSRVKWDNSQNSTQKWGPRAQQSWIVEDMDRLPQTLLSNYNDGCGQSDQKFGSLVVGKGEIFYGGFMLDFVFIVMVCVEVPSLVVGVWEWVLYVVEGFVRVLSRIVTAAIGQLITDS